MGVRNLALQQVLSICALPVLSHQLLLLGAKYTLASGIRASNSLIQINATANKRL